MDSQPIIETPRLKLVPWSDGHGRFVRDKLNTREVTRHTGGPLKPFELDGWIEALQESQDRCGFTQWPVVRYDGAILGLCGLMIDDDEDSPCLGCKSLAITFASEYWGHGYAREAALGCLRYAFDTLDDHRIVAMTTRRNRPSWSLMQDIGMKPDHRLDYRSRIGRRLNIAYVVSWRDWEDFKDGYQHQRMYLDFGEAAAREAAGEQATITPLSNDTDTAPPPAPAHRPCPSPGTPADAHD